MTETFALGDYVRIVGSHTRPFENLTGTIVELPNDEHPERYAVKLDGGLTGSAIFENKVVLQYARDLIEGQRLTF